MSKLNKYSIKFNNFLDITDKLTANNKKDVIKVADRFK